MKKVLKWIGIIIGSLLGLIVLVFLGLVFKGNSMLKKTYDVQVETIPIPTDEAAIARGEHWVMAECIGCHGEDLSGGAFFEAPFATVNSKNLTTGKGGAGTEFEDIDWIRALRYGVNPEGSSLLIMPSHAFRFFSDADLGDIIAYLKVAPPVDKETSEPSFNLLGKALLGAGAFGDSVVIAETINNNAIDPTYPPAGVTPEYGQYLINVSACRDCHGVDLSGGKSADPSAKYAPNLTSGGELIAWKEEDFIKAIRTGLTPTDRQLDPLQMPWEHYKYFSDDELKAIWAYLESLPRLESTVP
ncbi:MAG: c-type cytochrome [Anaerolineales bacterium]|nr:c-type cytochrome [Anaerolineales bacterium]